jgi:hypothetical protein
MAGSIGAAAAAGGSAVADTPIEDDIRHDDMEYNPALEPKSAKAWLNLLAESEEVFEAWNNHCDNIDKQYASLERLAQSGRDKEFQMLWANLEVLKPSIYAKPPVPVVVPKFEDRRPVYQAASEVMERCANVAFDLAGINDLMLQVRDDVAMISRGVAWCRYESGKGGYYDHERVCIDFKHRRDFLHSISRCWYEVTWVAAASYLTRGEARERFQQYSGDAYQDAEYKVDKDSKEIGGADNRERAKFWEIWHKGQGRVVWVACGCEDILDEAEAEFELRGFFPCPKPAYGTCQRGSLVPVPDVMQYKDQLDEVNLLTGRIHALSDALTMKGFYPAGGGEVADAVQTAFKTRTAGEVMVPISNWAAFGGNKEVIIWMPIAEVAGCITSVVELRKQVIDDIYQIMGLSDIMRGATDPRETLGAQNLKTQYGSTRIRDKQQELARLARDLVEITCEIMAQKFAKTTIIEMSQTLLPTQAMQRQAVMQLQQQLQAQMQQYQQQASSPQAQQLMQASPDQAQHLQTQAQAQLQQGQEAIRQLTEQPTIDQVFTFLQNNRMRTFVLDIETDSTIMIDETAEKQARGEFMGMLGNVLPQLAAMMGAEPKSAQFCGELLKFAVAPFRAGRSLGGAIDELVAMMQAKADGPRPDDPTTATNKTAIQIEQIKTQRQKTKDDADTQLRATELQMKDQHEKMKIASQEKMKLAELMAKQGDAGQKAQAANQKAMHDRENHQMDIIGRQADMQADARKMQMAEQAAIARQGDMAARASERHAAQQYKQQQGTIMPG